jgi:hypothetical protein
MNTKPLTVMSPETHSWARMLMALVGLLLAAAPAVTLKQ